MPLQKYNNFLNYANAFPFSTKKSVTTIFVVTLALPQGLEPWTP